MKMTLSRGDVVVCVLAGDYGKPRPAVIVQSDLFNSTHSSVVVCPITSYLIDAPLFRKALNPTDINGLSSKSQIMTDKLTAIKTEKIAEKIGKLTEKEINDLNNAIK